MRAIWIATLVLLASSSARADDMQVVTTVPARHTLAATNATVAINFDRPVNPATITHGTFRVFGRGSGTAGGSFSFSNGNQTVTLTPGAFAGMPR